MQPYNVTQAIGLAKLVEAKIKDSRTKSYKPTYNHTTTQSSTSTQFKFARPPPPNPIPLPIKRLTPAQMQERRAQGLCYNCDEKFVPGHKCYSRCFLLLMVVEVNQKETYPELSQPEEQDAINFQLSSQALTS
jgi:hypothetical protein